MKWFLLIVCLLVSGSVAIDFTTIGQKEIVDYIKNRADLLHGTKLSGRNLQDLLSNAVFTGLEEEALTFAYGSSVKSTSGNDDDDQLSARLTVLAASSADSAPLKILLTSDTLGTTSIALGELTTSQSSSSKSSVGDFIVNCDQQSSFDSTTLDGSITINLGSATDSHNLTLTKTIYLAAEVNVTSLGADWESSSLLTNEGKLLSLLNSKEGSMYIVTYQSLIRETIKAGEGDLFGGLKSSGKVLLVVDSEGMVSLSGRTISGKIEATWGNEAEENVDSFLTLNGSKSRRFMISDLTKSKSSSNLIANQLKASKDISMKNWLYDSVRHGGGSSNRGNRGNRGNQNEGHRTNYRGSQGGKVKGSNRASWKASCLDGSTWPSWRSFWDFGYGYRYGWNSWGFDDWEFNFDDDEDWSAFDHKSSTTPKPVKATTKKPIVTPSTPKPIETVKPTIKPEIKMTTQPTATSTIKTPEPDLSEPTFTDLPQGTTVSLWTTRLI